MSAWVDLRDQYIARVVSGKTFGEVGGLWGTVNEKASVAHQNGATSLTMIDITPPENELWQKFEQRMEELSVEPYQCISGDICDEQVVAQVERPFDVVHCSGVLYHHPNPMFMLSAFRRITGQYLVLTSCITHEHIENEFGSYRIPSSGVLFVPALDDAEHAILKRYWEQHVEVAHGLTDQIVYDVNEFGPWWFLPTATAMKAMCQAAGFKIEDGGLTWNDNCLTLLLSV